VAPQLLKLQTTLRARVWAASHVRLRTVTVDTDTTVHTIYGDKMGARKSYNPKNKGCPGASKSHNGHYEGSPLALPMRG
jgi:hypothetical protein